jgi:sensor histidine kinase YesM
MKNRNPGSYYSLSHWKYPAILALSLSAINFLSTLPFRDSIVTANLFGAWFIASSFLVLMWYVNLALSNRLQRKNTQSFWRIFITVGINLFFLAVFVFIAYLIMSSVLERNFSIERIVVQSIKSALGIATMIFFQYVFSNQNRVQMLQLQNEKLKSENTRVQYEMLLRQVHPHFLFNSLSVLHSMADSNQPETGNYILSLSGLFREILDIGDKETRTLREELAFTENYLNLMRYRFEDAFSVDIRTIPLEENRLLPVFSLHLLVENCFRHNAVSKSNLLRIEIVQQSTEELIVRNNRVPKEPEAVLSGFGLSGITERYRLLGVENGLVVIENDTEFVASLKLLPCENSDC